MTTGSSNKVARITLLFWLLKIVATTLGETLGDFIAMTLNLGYTIGILVTLAFFLVVLLASRGLTGTDHVDGQEPEQ